MRRGRRRNRAQGLERRQDGPLDRLQRLAAGGPEGERPSTAGLRGLASPELDLALAVWRRHPHPAALDRDLGGVPPTVTSNALSWTWIASAGVATANGDASPRR